MNSYLMLFLVLMFVLWLRHRINPTLMEGVAAGYPFDTQPEPTQDTVAFYRFLGIGRAGWVVTAIITEKGADQVTVALDQHKDHFFHNWH